MGRLALRYFTVIFLVGTCFNATAESLQNVFNQFDTLYQQRFTATHKCSGITLNEHNICADEMRADGNAPFILHHGKPTNMVVVLVHGLSDSPFYMRAIAAAFYAQGYNVIAPLLPGHGVKEADAAMEDNQLAEKWQDHVADIMKLAPQLGNKVVVGGFSTGGALVVDYYLTSPDDIQGITLFSGALALNGNVESLSKIWGVKWLAKLMDGDYKTYGPNPHKYPSVSSFAGLELMDIINEIRAQLDAGKTIEVPLFVAHSEADTTTPIAGVENLLNFTNADNSFFRIDENYNLCHADLVVNRKLLADMHFNKAAANAAETCAIPQPNPLFFQMMKNATGFIGLYE